MKTLERIRGSSRFESTAAEEGCAGTLYVLSNLCDLFLCLDGAGACDDLKAAAADLSAADIDDCVVRVHGAVCLLIRLTDPADILNDVVGL